MAAEWLSCLQATAAAVVLVGEADKLTLGQKLSVFVPHAVQTCCRALVKGGSLVLG